MTEHQFTAEGIRANPDFDPEGLFNPEQIGRFAQQLADSNTQVERIVAELTKRGYPVDLEPALEGDTELTATMNVDDHRSLSISPDQDRSGSAEISLSKSSAEDASMRTFSSSRIAEVGGSQNLDDVIAKIDAAVRPYMSRDDLAKIDAAAKRAPQLSSLSGTTKAPAAPDAGSPTQGL